MGVLLQKLRKLLKPVRRGQRCLPAAQDLHVGSFIRVQPKTSASYVNYLLCKHYTCPCQERLRWAVWLLLLFLTGNLVKVDTSCLTFCAFHAAIFPAFPSHHLSPSHDVLQLSFPQHPCGLFWVSDSCWCIAPIEPRCGTLTPLNQEEFKVGSVGLSHLSRGKKKKKSHMPFRILNGFVFVCVWAGASRWITRWRGKMGIIKLQHPWLPLELHCWQSKETGKRILCS